MRLRKNKLIAAITVIVSLILLTIFFCDILRHSSTLASTTHEYITVAKGLDVNMIDGIKQAFSNSTGSFLNNTEIIYILESENDEDYYSLLVSVDHIIFSLEALRVHNMSEPLNSPVSIIELNDIIYSYLIDELIARQKIYHISQTEENWQQLSRIVVVFEYYIERELMRNVDSILTSRVSVSLPDFNAPNEFYFASTINFSTMPDDKILTSVQEIFHVTYGGMIDRWHFVEESDYYIMLAEGTFDW